MNFDIQQIADWIGAEIIGDPNQVIDHFSAIEEGIKHLGGRADCLKACHGGALSYHGQ